jgi:type IX secretion system PorP/SprF family membrane protein
MCTGLLILINYTVSQAQETFSNQYRYLPTYLNPALVGSDCGTRLYSFYQNQNNNSFSYQNFGLNVDAPIYNKNNFKIGTGYKFTKDVAGESKFSNSSHLLAVSASKTYTTTAAKQEIALGFEGGIARRSINPAGIRWPSQIGPTGFDPKIPSGVDFDQVIRFIDMNIGVQYSIHWKEQYGITMGMSFAHINQPNVSFLFADENEKVRTNLYVTANYRLNDKFEFLPSFIYAQHGQHHIYNVNMGTRYYLKPKSWICLDLGYLQYQQPFVGISTGIKKLIIFGSYNFVNNAGLTKIETGISYVFGSKNCN